VLEIIATFFMATLGAAYATNPFSRFSIVRLPYRVRLSLRAYETVNRNHKIIVHTSLLWRLFAWYQCGLYILTTRYVHQPASSAATYNSIIADIHELRYDPEKLLLISGDHFNGLFVRNLGVFYYPLLDANIYTTERDWRQRQEVFLQSVAYALGSYAKHPVLTTTIVSMGRYSTTNINFYSFPSDSLYGILYSLAVLVGYEDSGSGRYKKPDRKVDTVAAANTLLDEYRPLLVKLYQQYKRAVINEETGLVRTDVHLSGAKDITKRQSSFYDNVIYWKTTAIAADLGIIEINPHELVELKKTILATFWLADEGYFLEDLSSECRKEKFYSSDWLIVLSTGFLNLKIPKERRYYEQAMKYIQKNNIARPFAIKYQNDTRAHRQFLPVRLAVASYGGDSIWSFWGMEYIKVCLLLAQYTQDTTYRREADYHIKKYKENIVRFKGFPEVYDARGDMLQTLFYKSIRMTGWVIGFEQVLKMRAQIGAKR